MGGSTSSAEGRKRFEILRINQERSFLQAEVLMIEDEPGASAAGRDSPGGSSLHSEILAIAGAKQDLSAADPALLSFHLAGSLPLDLDFKQKLLSLRSETERLSLLISYLRNPHSQPPSRCACPRRKPEATGTSTEAPNSHRS